MTANEWLPPLFYVIDNYTNEKGHFLKHYSNGTKHTYQVDLKNTPTSTAGCNYLDLNQYDLAAIEKASQYHCTKTLSKNNSKGCDVNCSGKDFFIVTKNYILK